LVYGKKAKLPCELEFENERSHVWDGTSENDIQKRIEDLHTLTKVRSDAKFAIEEAKKKQKEYYDAKHNNKKWTVGGKVLLINSRKRGRQGGKLEKPLSGPYTITDELGKGTYRLLVTKVSETQWNHRIISPLKRIVSAKRIGFEIDRNVSFGRISTAANPRRFHVTVGDGNFLFRALSFVMSGWFYISFFILMF
jgi:hypothetical protein